MVRPVTSKYQIWLAGYYDDFLGARALPDDSNTPNVANTYDDKNSHHGNLLNGEATLNPRFRWSVTDRNRLGSTHVSSTTNKYLKNNGSFEFVSNDAIRQKHHKYEGRAHLQYPDGHTNANRSKYNEGTDSGLSGTDINGYQLFCNGYNTLGRYLVSTGTMDATYGREAMEAYYTDDSTFGDSHYANKKAGAFNSGGALAGGGKFRETSFANITGVWQGETLNFTDTTTPLNLFHPVKSPSGKSFLVIHTGANNNNPIISYDGTLNSKLDGDVFTARVCIRSFVGTTNNAGSPPKITFKIGYAATTLTDSKGFTATPAITYEWFNAKYSSGRAYTYDYFGGSYVGNNTDQNISNDDCWLDFDFVMDYANSEYDVYCDGELLHAGENMAGTPTAESMYGWQIESSASENHSTLFFMIDRVGLIRPLSDHMKHADRVAEAPISDLSLSLTNNGFSTCSFSLHDDAEDTDTDNTYGEDDADYAHNKLKNLFSASTPSNWEVLLFGDESNRIDRPIWRGVITNFSISEGVRQGRKIKINANDRTALLDTQLPVWDIGQESIPTEYGTEVPYWLTETEGYKEMMYLGTKQLKLLDKSIGFNSGNSYLEESNQRMKLYSGLPIQMYNNEITEFGPNNLHDYYEGIDIVGFGKVNDGAWHSVPSSGGTVRSFVEIAAKHASTGYSLESTALKITNSNISSYNTTSNITLKTKFDTPSSHDESCPHHSGNQLLFFDGLTYTPETAKIVMVSNYRGIQFDDPLNQSSSSYNIWQAFNNNFPAVNDPTTDTYNFYMDADPSLNIGDYIYVNFMHDDTSDTAQLKKLSHYARGRQKVVNVKRIHNYFVSNDSETWQTNFLWVVTTDRPVTELFLPGDYVNSTLLSGTARFSWQRDTKAVLTPSTTNHALTQYRNLHTQWMTDLPKSLWFQYRYGQINRLAKATGRVEADIAANTTSVKINVGLYNKLNVAGKKSGVAEIRSITSQTYNYAKFIYKGIAQVSSDYYLIGVQFLNVPFLADATGNFTNVTFVDVCDISDDYKHLWLLWADMRNNGQANADGESRKTDFGLTSPIFQNYKPTLYFTDQFKTDGQVDKFTDLKIGEDIVIENVNPVSDISTLGPMSKPVDYDNANTGTMTFAEHTTTGVLKVTTQAVHGLSTGDYVHIYNSNLHDGHYQITVIDNDEFTCGAGTWKGSDSGATGGLRYAPITGSEADILTKYHDWEDKAGAFLVIDTSPFFNLNTFINGGKVGQIAGGNTNLIDYNVKTKGFPALIDNYYNEALPSYKNVDGGLKEHENQLRILSDATLIDSTVFSVDNGISIGDAGIMVDDLTIFDDSGIGRIMARQKDDGSKVNTDKDYYFTWSMKQEIEYTAALFPVGNAGTTGLMTGATIPAGHTELRTAAISGDSTFLEWGAKPGMLIFRTTNADPAVTTKHKIVEVHEYDYSGTTYQDRILVTGVWADSDTWKIPKQLGGIKLVPATAENVFESATSSSSGLEQSIMNYIDTNNVIVGSPVNILLKDETTSTEDRYDNITVNSTVSNQYALRLLMHLEGRVESKSSGTYYDSDKFRSLWLSSLLYNWRAPVKLPLMYDINNIPLTNNMTSDGGTSNIDDYGSILNANSKNLLSITKDISKGSGFGTTNNHHTSFSWLAGRDGRLSYRPKYNSGVSFDRLNVHKNSFKSEVSGQISNVRVFYNQSKSFIDYPATNLTDSTSWKVIEMPQIISSLEALKIAQKEYNKNKTSKLVLNVTPRQDSYLEDTLMVNVADKMLHTGRYGYIADPYIAFHGNGEITSASYQYWTRLGSGGALFTGAQNGLDGNMKTSTDIYNRYGQSSAHQAKTASADVAWDNNFYWYGAKSISYAVQVVDVANRCPLVSETTGEDMRMFVAIKPNQTGVSIDDLVFTVYMVDYAYSDARLKVTQTADANNIGSVDVKGNGFYEIPIPKTYWANNGVISGAKIIISVNTDYCRALLRHRCGDPTHANIVRNANSLKNINLSANGSGSDYNDQSIFPLGGKIFDEFYMFDEPRREYYAPRVHICKDMKYRPATYVTYTDKSLDLSNEILTIEKINWRVSMANEELSLTLINDESLNTSTVEQFLFSSANNPVFQPIPPPVSTLPSIENSTSDSTVSNSNTVGGQGQSTTFPSPEPSGSTGVSFSEDNNINNMSSTTYGNITNRIGLGDDMSSFSEFSILGQTRPNVVPSSNRGIDASVDFKPTGGTATMSDDGISFPGVGFTEDSGTPVNITTAKLKVKIPKDIKTNDISINSYITHAVNQPSSNVAELTVTVTCDQNGNSKSQTTLINANLNNSYNSLFSNKLVGAEVAGNTLTVEIKRIAGSTNDSSDYNSVVLSDTEITLNRASGHSRASTNTFTTYS